jgi:PAS domain S-box-containing protein
MTEPNAPTILFVDDDALLRNALTRPLERAGLRVVHAATGADTLRLARDRPDLIILDVQLPDQSGIEVCRQLKASALTRTIPVLYLSGHFISTSDRVEGLDAGAEGYLIKPISPVELVAQVRALVRAHRAEEALLVSERRLQDILDNAPVVVNVKDLQGRYLLVNRHWEERFGLRREEVVGRTPHDIFPPEQADAFLVNDRQVLEAGQPLTFEEVAQEPDGPHTYLSSKFALPSGPAKPYGVCGISTDITERKQSEKERARAAAEMAVARRIQQRLFPSETPRVPGLDIGAASYLFDLGGASFPAEAIGGDYYDYLCLPDGALGIAVGDVSGHGVGPALLMAETRAFLRACAQGQPDVSAILAQVNRLLVRDIEDDYFITMLLARLAPDRRSLVYASAGHATGYLFDSEGALKCALPSTSIPLGIDPDAPFPASETVPLAPGDLVLFLTDGVTEARDPEGTAFGTKRVLDLMRVYRASTARQIVDNLYHAVRAFARNEPQVDDITATVLKVHAHS